MEQCMNDHQHRITKTDRRVNSPQSYFIRRHAERMRHEMQKAGSGESADSQTNHPHQAFLVAIGFDEGHDDGASQGAKADDGDEEDAISNALGKRDVAFHVRCRFLRGRRAGRR